MSELISRRHGRTPPGRMRSDEGAAAVEYVGIVIAVVALLLSLAVLFAPLGDVIYKRYCEAVASLTGGTCASPVAQVPDDNPPDVPCVQSSDEFNAEFGVSIAFVDLGAGMAMVTEKLSDGTYQVALIDKGKIGATLSSGGIDAKLKIGGYGGEYGAGASVSAALEGAYGKEYTFNSAEDASKFQEWAAAEYGQKAASSGGPATGLAYWTGRKLMDAFTGYDYKPPAPSAVYGEANVVISGQAEAGAIVAGAGADISFGTGAGVRLDSDGNTTVYTKVTLDGQAAIDLGLQPTSGSVGVETVVAVTVDSSGEVTEVGFTGAASAEGSYNLTQLAGMPLQDAGGKGIGLNATFPVTDANRADTLTALAGLGVVQVSGGGAMAQAVALPWIMNQALADGDVWVQTYDVSADQLLGAALGVEAPAVGGLGFTADAATSSKTSTGAWYRGRDGWLKWEECS